MYYHLQAMKYGNELWKPFKEKTDLFLNSWETQKKSLVIVGPSGGYSLSPTFLQKFSKIHLIEIDPIAPLIFKFKNRSQSIFVDDKDYLNNGPAGLEELLKKYSDSAILFSNILGQLVYFKKGTQQVKELIPNLLEMLVSFDWASYHDVASFHFKKDPSMLCWPLVLNSITAPDYNKKIEAQLNLKPLEYEYIDHLIDDYFIEYKLKMKCVWQIQPNSYHIIHGYFSTK